MTISDEAGLDDLNRRMSENVTALLFRMGWKQVDLARATGITTATLSRKLLGRNEWTLSEVAQVAATLHVSVDELLATLPEWAAWRGRALPHLDSNQEPSGYRSVQVSSLDVWRERRRLA